MITFCVCDFLEPIDLVSPLHLENIALPKIQRFFRSSRLLLKFQNRYLKAPFKNYVVSQSILCILHLIVRIEGLHGMTELFLIFL